ERLRHECEPRDNQIHFRLLELYDIDEGGKELTYEQVAGQFGLKPVGCDQLLVVRSSRVSPHRACATAGDDGQRRRIPARGSCRVGFGRSMKTAVPPKWLSDSALDHLRAAADAPDLSATRYVLVDKLGQGGMSSVYRVEDTILGRRVALKVIGFADASGELAARLLHEAKVIARLEHPGIVPVHDVGTL